MKRLLTAFSLHVLAILSFCLSAASQELSPVALDFRVSLVPESKIVAANDLARLKLTVRALQDEQVDADLLTAVKLDVVVDGQPGPQLRQMLTEGKVKVAKDTVIERNISVRVNKLLGDAEVSGMTTISVQWPGLAGASCVLQVTPDLSKVSIEDMDLEKTKVVLVTNYGEMTLGFYPGRAPETVRNFVKLAKDGFYNGQLFHRVVSNFMIQGGCPLTKDEKRMSEWGRGDPGYKVKGEVNQTKHVRGVISMANSGSPDTAGSQFFICHKDAPHLNQGYTAFGALEEGHDTLDRIASVPVGPTAGGERSRPLDPVHLYRAVVLPAMK